MDVRIVMELLGHSQVSSTQNTYQHVIPQVSNAASQRVADVLLDR